MSVRARQSRLILAASLLAASSFLLPGCGPGAEGGLVPVSGRVTLDGGPWPKPGKITFVPMNQDAAAGKLRPASADFDTSGNFTVTSYEGSKGLYPGEYWAAVECWEVEPGMSNPDALKAFSAGKKAAPPAGKSVVPKKYQDASSSGLSLKVNAASPPSAAFDVKTK